MSRVSIITASYNYENYIRESIESVINQTFSDWEMIIVDDGSSDNSVKIIKEYCKKDTRIRFYCHENNVNKGLAETLKLGISKASSEWITFLEADDTIDKEYLEKKLKIIEKYSDVSFIFNDVNMFGEEDIINEYKPYFEKQKKILYKYEYPAKLLKAFKSTHKNLIPTFSCVMLKKDLLSYLDFNSPVKKALDYYLWIQLSKTSTCFYCKEKLTNWRMHKNSYINSACDNDYDKFKYNLKRIYFLHGRFAFLKYFLLFIKNFGKIFCMQKLTEKIYEK